MKRDKKAFTFIETVISLSLLAIIFIGLARIFQVGMMSVYKTNQEIIATNLARGLMTEIMSKKFDENDALPWTVPLSLGPEAGPPAETRYGATRFDDVDDYHNYAESIPPLTIGNQVMDYYSGFSRSVSVKYVTAAMQDSVTATDYKEVEVTVNAPGIPSFKLTEVKASQ